MLSIEAMNLPPSSLSDDELLDEVTRLAGCERAATAQLVAHLAELDARRLYLGAGYSSLFMYCRGVLRLSEHGSYNRIEAARTARRFPLVLEMLSDGRLNLATLRLLAPHMAEENHGELLAAASGSSKREIEELIAQRFPRADVATAIRKLPIRHSAAVILGVPSGARALVNASAEGPSELRGGSSGETPPLLAKSAVETAAPAAAAATQPARRSVVAPLSTDRYQITFTASADTLARLGQAQDLLRHAVPSGDAAEIIGRALTVLVETLTSKKFGASDRARSPRRAVAGSRHIPAAVKRAVWMRDDGRCGFVGKGGRRCDERGFLEFHHVSPYAAGGKATVDNIELRCRPHNEYEADLFYGPIRLAMSQRNSAHSLESPQRGG
jgi:hypothetical protein